MKLKDGVLMVLLAGCWLILSGWGYKGHEIIGKNSGRSFHTSMGQFEAWIPVLTSHSADADKRKSWDDTEDIKHYIDIDNYPEYNENGFISQDLDSLIAKYGRKFIEDQGTLPWATLKAYDSLVSLFRSRQYDAAALIAADLSHYVADGHMPLHLTRNYDGQFTGNKGIHSRYESTMVGKFASQFVYEGAEISFVEDVPGYVFSYIYQNYPLLDSILRGDDYAQEVSSSTTSSAYNDTLWAMTGAMTIDLFSGASASLAELIYSAWLTAGSPSFDDHTFVQLIAMNQSSLGTVYYEDSSVVLHLDLLQPGNIVLDIFSMNGERISQGVSGVYTEGNHRIVYPLQVPRGNYLLKCSNNGTVETKKFNVD
jgi:hypothetical protein